MKEAIQESEFVSFVPTFLVLSLSCVTVLRLGLDCCDGWLINPSTHPWWLLWSDYWSSILLLSHCQFIAYPYMVQLQPNFWAFWVPNLCVFSCVSTEVLPVFSHVGSLNHSHLEPLLLALHKAHFLEEPAIVFAQHWTCRYFVSSPLIDNAPWRICWFPGLTCVSSRRSWVHFLSHLLDFSAFCSSFNKSVIFYVLSLLITGSNL